ncbi:JmjC domain-containing protein [Streptomyces sp. NPDC055109]
MTITIVDEVLGDWSVFMHYFNHAPFLRPAALKVDPRSLLSTKRLNEILHLEGLRPANLRVMTDGAPVHPGFYMRPVEFHTNFHSDCIDPKTVGEMFQEGATLIWNSLNHTEPALRAILCEMTDRFSCEGEVAAFMTPGGYSGIPAHQDTTENFVIQIEGTKRWKVWETRKSNHQIGEHVQEPGHHEEPIVDVTLQPGDVLYIPRGTPHAAVAENETSLHVSIILHPRTWGDILTGVISGALRELQETDFILLGRDQISAERLREKLQQLCSLISKIDEEREIARIGDRRGESAGAGQIENVFMV